MLRGRSTDLCNFGCVWKRLFALGTIAMRSMCRVRVRARPEVRYSGPRGSITSCLEARFNSSMRYLFEDCVADWGVFVWACVRASARTQ